jgi:hypothetical protein
MLLNLVAYGMALFAAEHSLLHDLFVWAVVTVCLEVLAVLGILTTSRLRRLNDDGSQSVQRRDFMGIWRWTPLSASLYNAVWSVFYLTVAFLLLHWLVTYLRF